MLVFIYFFILLVNVVAIALNYHFLGKDMDKKSKGIFIVIGIAIMYILVSFVYWISTKDINLGVDTDMGKNLVTFTFVPVNAILVMPFLASSYKHFMLGDLNKIPFRNRCILIAVILIVLLVFEFFYFKDIQNGILSFLQGK